MFRVRVGWFSFVFLFMFALCVGSAIAGDPFVGTSVSSDFISADPSGNCPVLIDSNTGLMWMKNIPWSSCASAYPWTGLEIESLYSVESCGGEWRYPNLKELYSLSDLEPVTYDLVLSDKLSAVGFVFGARPEGFDPVFVAGEPMNPAAQGGTGEPYIVSSSMSISPANGCDAGTGQYYWPLVSTSFVDVPSVDVVSFAVHEYAPLSGRKYLKGNIRIRSVDLYVSSVDVKLYQSSIGGANKVLIKTYRVSSLRPGISVNQSVYLNGGLVSWLGKEYSIEVAAVTGHYLKDRAESRSSPVVLE